MLGRTSGFAFQVSLWLDGWPALGCGGGGGAQSVDINLDLKIVGKEDVEPEDVKTRYDGEKQQACIFVRNACLKTYVGRGGVAQVQLQSFCCACAPCNHPLLASPVSIDVHVHSTKKMFVQRLKTGLKRMFSGRRLSLKKK